MYRRRRQQIHDDIHGFIHRGGAADLTGERYAGIDHFDADHFVRREILKRPADASPAGRNRPLHPAPHRRRPG